MSSHSSPAAHQQTFESVPPHHRSSSRQSSTSSLHSIKRKPVPTELDQLKHLGNELLGTPEPRDREAEEVLQDGVRPNLLPHSTVNFDAPFASTTSYPPPAPSPSSTLSRQPSTSSRPVSRAALSNATGELPTTYPIQPNSLDPSSSRPPTTRSTSASSHASESVFGSPPQGTIGKTVPREIVRIERDYSSGTGIAQFWPGWIWELEGRVSPTVYQTILNDLNSILASAHDPYKSIFDNVLAVVTLWIAPMIVPSHYEKQMKRFDECLQRVNREHLNSVGLNLLNPEKNAFLFLELEYY